ncbi:MAG: PilZ domain-containing protein [Candidatus Eremiobacteraeota bacterium]|nr:PilZ domain-containing protein [Candidatus Eremiobacteraeota bacterium]
MLKSLFTKSSGIPLSKLPQLHSFVDVIVGGRPARQVTVESVGPKTIVTRETLGKPGETAVIVYQAPAGRFRAQTKIAATVNATTTFETPRKVSLIGAASGAQKRQSVRLDAIVAGQWRFAPMGVGSGEWAKCTIRDISRGGCSLIIDRGLKNHTQVEVKMQLRPEGNPLTLLGEVMRHEVIQASGKHSHGLRFHGIRPGEDQAIVEFINRRQADLRSRGLA